MELPFRAEYSNSRSNCKHCMRHINPGNLRIGNIWKMAMGQKSPEWFHRNCFFKSQRPESVNDIENFNNLRIKDQQQLDGKLASLKTVKPRKIGKKVHKDQIEALEDFGVECSKSGRSCCRICYNKISMNEVRIKKMNYECEAAWQYGKQPYWYHVDCFVKNHNELGWACEAKFLPGFKNLKTEDQNELKKKVLT